VAGKNIVFIFPVGILLIYFAGGGHYLDLCDDDAIILRFIDDYRVFQTYEISTVWQ